MGLLQTNNLQKILPGIPHAIPNSKKINVIDATFGGGSYSKSILESFKINKLIAIDRDPISKIFAQELEKKYPDRFSLINGCFGKIDQLINNILDLLI